MKKRIKVSRERALRFSLLAASVLMAGHASAVDSKPNGVLGGGGGNCATLSAAGANWDICDGYATDNGLPAGGQCSGGVSGSGATISDADFGGLGDAFDEGGFWVNNVLVGGVATYTATSASFAAQTIAGLSVQLRMDALSTQPTLRSYLTLSNPTGAPITVTVDYAINFGSDDGTVINGSASGDTLLSTADQWVVTSDGGPSDPVNTTVLFSGTPAVAPNATSTVVFDCADPDGVRGTYQVTVPAGATVALVTFQSLGTSIAQAPVDAAQFNNIQSGSPLLAGLSPTQVSAIRNIGAGAGLPTPVPRPAVVPVGGGSSALLALLVAAAGILSLGLLRRR